MLCHTCKKEIPDASVACFACGVAIQKAAPSGAPAPNPDRTYSLEEVQRITEHALDKKLGEILRRARPGMPLDDGSAGADPSQKSIRTKAYTGRIDQDTGLPEQKFHYERLSPEMTDFVSRFAKALRDRTAVTFKSITGGNNESAGFLIPGEFIEAVMEKAVTDSYFLSFSRVIPMTQDTTSFPLLRQTFGSSPDYYSGISWSWVGEGAQIGESTNPKYDLITLRAKKNVGMQILSSEVMEDAPGYASSLVNLVGRSFGWQADEVGWRGTGAGDPLGFLNETSLATVARQTASTVTLRDLVKLDSALDEAFTMPTYFMRKATGLEVPLELATGSGEPKVKTIWMDPTEAFKPRVILGYPVIYTKHAAALAAQGAIVLMDPSAFVIGMRKQLEMATSSDFLFDTDQVAMRWIARWDFRRVYKDAVQILAA
jgi:HK97 family phage major capsid protein